MKTKDKKILACVLATVLLASAMLVATPTNAQGVVVPGDKNGDKIVAKDELASVILPYMLGAGYLGLDEVREIAHIHVYYPRTIVDSADRTVTVYKPVKRIGAYLLSSAMALVILGAKDTIVAVGEPVIVQPWAPTTVTNMGPYGKPNIEAIISARPDVVIAGLSSPSPEDLENKLEPFGIEVIRLDLFKTDKIFAETRLIGLLVDRTKEADDLCNSWEGVLNTIKERVKGLEEAQKPRVYWEIYTPYTASGPGGWGDQNLNFAGGINIFADSPVPHPPVSSEAVVGRNPQVIIKSAPDKTYEATDPAPLKKYYDEILSRPGWSEIDAIKEGRVYVFGYQFLEVYLCQIVETAYVAKILHPDLFKDLDPVALHKHLLEENLGIPYKGVWIYPSLG